MLFRVYTTFPSHLWLQQCFWNSFLLNISNFQSIVLNLMYIYYNKVNYLIKKKIHNISRSINHTFKMILFFQVAQYHEHYGS